MTVYDVVQSATAELAREGAKPADSSKAVASDTDVVISMIPDDHALEEVSMGLKGVFEGAKPGCIYIDMSTVSPVLSARVGEAAEKRGIQYLRAPVSGSVESAKAATLTILVSVPRDAYERCKAIFEVMGQKCFHVGEKEEALYLKLLINIMVGVTSAVTAEAITFGKRGGLNWTQMIDIINNSVVASPLIGVKAQMLKGRRFPAAFSVRQMTKDFDLALDTGRAMDVPMPFTALKRQFYAVMKAQGKADLDYFGLAALAQEMAGLKD